jgi:hypothetical protein
VLNRLFNYYRRKLDTLRTRRNQLLLDTLAVLAKTHTADATIQQIKKLFEKEVLEESILGDQNQTGNREYNSMHSSISAQRSPAYYGRNVGSNGYQNDAQSWISSVSTHRPSSYERLMHRNRAHTPNQRFSRTSTTPKSGQQHPSPDDDVNSAVANVAVLQPEARSSGQGDVNPYRVNRFTPEPPALTNRTIGVSEQKEQSLANHQQRAKPNRQKKVEDNPFWTFF